MAVEVELELAREFNLFGGYILYTEEAHVELIWGIEFGRRGRGGGIGAASCCGSVCLVCAWWMGREPSCVGRWREMW